MKILRSIISIVAGLAATFVVVSSLQLAGSAMFPVPEEEAKKLMAKDTSRQQKWEIMQAFPTGAIATVPISWMFGAFLGGFTAAAIAGCCKSVHAGIIGGFNLLAAIAMLVMIPSPDWMILIGLATPLPFSLLAGLLASKLFTPREASPV